MTTVTSTANTPRTRHDAKEVDGNNDKRNE